MEHNLQFRNHILSLNGTQKRCQAVALLKNRFRQNLGSTIEQVWSFSIHFLNVKIQIKIVLFNHFKKVFSSQSIKCVMNIIIDHHIILAITKNYSLNLSLLTKICKQNRCTKQKTCTSAIFLNFYSDTFFKNPNLKLTQPQWTAPILIRSVITILKEVFHCQFSPQYSQFFVIMVDFFRDRIEGALGIVSPKDWYFRKMCHFRNLKNSQCKAIFRLFLSFYA